MHATIGRVVVYRSRTGRYSIPAIVTATAATLFEPGVLAGFVPGLTKDDRDRVHLTVLTPGLAGNRLPDTPASIAADAAGGSYQEHNIPFWSAPEGWTDYEQQPAGTWAWPPRV